MLFDQILFWFGMADRPFLGEQEVIQPLQKYEQDVLSRPGHQNTYHKRADLPHSRLIA